MKDLFKRRFKFKKIIFLLIGLFVVFWYFLQLSFPKDERSFEFDEKSISKNFKNIFDLDEQEEKVKYKNLSSFSIFTNQMQLNYISKFLDIKVQPIINENNNFYLNFILYNSGFKSITSCCWCVYFYSSKFLFTDQINNLINLKTLKEKEINLFDKFIPKSTLESPYDYSSTTKSVNYLNANIYLPFDQSRSFIFSHLSGYTFKFCPSVHFTSLQPKSKMIIRVVGSGWMVSKSEFFPNWYVASSIYNQTSPQIISSTADEELGFVGAFVEPLSTKRYSFDLYEPFTPQERFERNLIDLSVTNYSLGFIPSPLYFRHSFQEDLKNENLVFCGKEDFIIQYEDESLFNEIAFLKESLGIKKAILKKKGIRDKKEETFSKINLILLKGEKIFQFKNKTNFFIKNKNFIHFIENFKEAYELKVDKNGDSRCLITVAALSPPGIFYGIISLLQLIKNCRLSTQGIYNQRVKKHKSSFFLVPLDVVDMPRYKHRGVMVDVSRNFQSIETLMVLVSKMSRFKLNVLHLHLSDDEAWRLEIPDIPLLTKFGACRGHNPSERECLMSMLGSGPKTKTEYYSVEQFQSLLSFATKHHVMIIPEFDVPGHSHAAITSMLGRYEMIQKKKGQNKKNESEEKDKLDEKIDLLLSDLDDESEYITGQFYRNSSINPCISSTYIFISKVIYSLVKMYKNRNPLTYLHIGGDEVASNSYSASPACDKLKQMLLKRSRGSNSSKSMSHKLKLYFIERLIKFTGKLKLKLIGWQDAFTNSDGSFLDFESLIKKKEEVNRKPTNFGSIFSNKTKFSNFSGSERENQTPTIQYYLNNWESGLGSIPYQMANKGAQVILSPATVLYFDNPQEPDPNDWGLHWAARYVDTRRVFHFTPQNIYNSIEQDFSGNRISRKKICLQTFCPPLEKHQNIIGLEGVLWSELVRTKEKMNWMLYPRVLSLAERAWTRAQWEEFENYTALKTAQLRDWSRFAHLVALEMKQMDREHISYYIPKPGAKMINNKLYVNTMIPGMKVQMKKMKFEKNFTQETSGWIKENLGWIYVKNNENNKEIEEWETIQGPVDVSNIEGVLLRTVSFNKIRYSGSVLVDCHPQLSTTTPFPHFFNNNK